MKINKKLFLLLVISVAVLATGTANAAIGNWSKDTAGIREFVNSKGYNIPTSYNGQGLVNFDSATALKVCQLAGYNYVVSKSCGASDGRCGFTSCSDNVLAKWNSSTNNFDMLNACSAGNTWLASLVCGNVVCSSDSQCGTSGYTGNAFCSNGDVYKTYKTYKCNNAGTINSSCSNSTEDKLMDDCSANETCSDGECHQQPQNITCSTNSQCGTSGYTGSLFCQDGNVYQNYTAYTCNNAGTPSSYCSNNTSASLKKVCTENQTCQNGACMNKPITCSTHSQCGTSGYVGLASCQYGNVYQNYIAYTCNNAGTPSSSCSNATTFKLKQTCGTNQICSNGACIQQNITCSTNSQCGTNGYVGSPFCSGGDVYKTYRTYTCSNPGTANSSCSSSTEDKIVTDCTTNQICQNGACVNQNIACSTNSQCGTNGYTGNAFCSNGDVYKTYATFTCNNPGTTNSSCSSNTEDKLMDDCSANETCSAGQCQQQNIACSTNSQCGTNGYVGSPFCSGGDVYKTYRTYTCSNPGTANSSCSLSTQDKLIENCTSNETCSNGTCNQENIECDSNSDCGTNGYIGSPFCSNGDVYKAYRTYTCKNPGTSSSYCSTKTTDELTENCTNNETCSNGSCSSNCTDHSYRQCSGNYLYWYDSCGNRDEIAEYCSNGCSGSSCNYSNNLSVQTNSATSITNNQATLNGYVYGYNNYNSNYNYVWFQWGTSTSYGNETTHQSLYNSGNFSQVVNLYNYGSNTTYHYRAVAQNNNGGNVYGQDMTFTTGYNTTGSLNVTKTVRNLSSGSTGFSTVAYASPSDVVMFMITIQSNNNESISNVYVRDTLPANLIYKSNLIVSGNSNYSGDITSGMNFGTITNGQTITITYQAQVASASNFAYGTTTLNNSVSVTGSNLINNPTSNASVVVTRSAVYGISTISTGLTNNFWVDSFFLPLIIALGGLWMIKSGMFFGVEKWVYSKRKNGKIFRVEKKLDSKIAKIRELEQI